MCPKLHGVGNIHQKITRDGSKQATWWVTMYKQWVVHVNA